MVELLVYLSLLVGLISIIFSFVWQIQAKNKKILSGHTSLQTSQMAMARLIQDLQQSRRVEIKSKHGSVLISFICHKKTAQISWQLSREKILWRVDESSQLKKPAISKVAENIGQLKIKQNQSKPGAILVDLKLVDGQQNIFNSAVALRTSLKL